MSLWLLGVLMVGGAILFSVGGLWLTRRYVSSQTLREHHDVAGFILAIVGVIYAVLLAFVVLVVWERYGEAEITAEREANAVLDIYRLAPGLSPRAKTELRGEVRFYARSVVEKEFPAMNRGEDNHETSRALDKLWNQSLLLGKSRDGQSEVYSKILDRLTDVSDQRRLRLLSSRSGLPGPMWFTLIAGAVLTIVFTYYFGLEKFKSQAGMTAILAALIALVLFLISSLNYPFTGDLRVKPEAMEAVLSRFDDLEKHERN